MKHLGVLEIGEENLLKSSIQLDKRLGMGHFAVLLQGTSPSGCEGNDVNG